MCPIAYSALAWAAALVPALENDISLQSRSHKDEAENNPIKLETKSDRWVSPTTGIVYSSLRLAEPLSFASSCR